jgi:hypothetical protein
MERMSGANPQPAQASSQKKPTYWEQRKDSVYLHAARLVCRRFGANPKSVIDVGSNGTPTLEWHRETASRLVSLDLRRPYEAAGIESVTSDLLAFDPGTKFDLVTCFQVLEHVPNPKAFARKLLALGDVVVISVPYKWAKGRVKFHIHDPVDEAKLLEWFGRTPVYSHLSEEIELDRAKRLIQTRGRWTPVSSSGSSERSRSASERSAGRDTHTLRRDLKTRPNVERASMEKALAV